MSDLNAGPERRQHNLQVPRGIEHPADRRGQSLSRDKIIADRDVRLEEDHDRQRRSRPQQNQPPLA